MRLPADAVLIVVAGQEAISDCAPAVEANLASLVAAWRKEGLPAIPVRLGSRSGAPGEACATPPEGERVSAAGAASAFAATELEASLDDAGATTLVLCGALGCVEATARDAGALGYQVFIPLDACWPAVRLVDHAAARIRRAGAAVVDTRATLAAADLAKARQRRERRNP